MWDIEYGHTYSEVEAGTVSLARAQRPYVAAGCRRRQCEMLALSGAGGLPVLSGAQGHTGPVNAWHLTCAVSRCIRGADRTVKALDVQTGVLSAEGRGMGGSVIPQLVSSKRQKMASGARNVTARTWDGSMLPIPPASLQDCRRGPAPSRRGAAATARDSGLMRGLDAILHKSRRARSQSSHKMRGNQGRGVFETDSAGIRGVRSESA